MARFYDVVVLCAVLFIQACPSAWGQPVFSEAPSRLYLETTLPTFYHGNFDNTLNLLNNRDLRTAVRLNYGNQQIFLWLDSLCYWTLYGECQFQMARYDEALNAFTTALRIYMEQSDWLKSITVSDAPGMAPRQPLPWGASLRPGHVGDFSPCRFLMTHEHLAAVPVGDQLGMMVQTMLTPIQADHIVHCLALTIRRRAEILGNLSKYDPETKKLADILANRPHLPNHWTGSWVDVLHGLSLSALGDETGAEAQLTRGLLMGGVHDHQLTAVALNELGNIALSAGKAEEARTYYLEASFSAYHLGDPVLLGETFRNMANAHRLLQKSVPFPPITQASVFFRSVNDVSPMTLLPILHEEAEGNITLRRIPEAKTINELSAAMMKRTINGVLFDTAHGARYHYLAATLAYAEICANLIDAKRSPPQLLEAGNKHLASALDFLGRGSLRLYQLDKLETFFQGGMITSRGPITERVADELYDTLLRVATDADWTLQPMDCFVALVATPLRAYEQWFAVALRRGNREKAFEIAERARQARFFAALPLAESRLMAFRLLFEWEEGLLVPEALVQRQMLALEFGEFNRLSENVRNIKRHLIGIPIVPQNPDQVTMQKALFAELEQQSAIQESVLRVMALSRTQVPQIFPPVMSLEQIRKELPEGTAMLTFTESLGGLYGFLIDQRSLAVWQVQAATPRDKPLHDLITEYLQDLGNRGAGQAVSVKDVLANPLDKWKESGAKLLKRLLGNEVRPMPNLSELVIVPTGALWYVPFEAMSVPSGDQLRPLLTAGQNLTIRYAPTASLGVPLKSGRRVNAETLVMCGKLMPRDSAEVSLEAVNRFTQSGIKNLTVMESNDKNSPFPTSASVFASRVQHLVVLDDIPFNPPLGWSPFTNDRTRAKNPVATWLSLPWGGPSLVVLPAFHTPAEVSLRGSALQNGDDLFLSSMLLEACGARTILISRWRTGGRVSYDLVEQFLLQLAEKPAAEAWRRAILEIGSNPIKVEEEPRVRMEPKMEVPIANHPFFWGAFMLIDRGETPSAE